MVQLSLKPPWWVRACVRVQAVKARLNALPSERSRAPPSTAGSAMLQTIKVPRNFAMIKGKLPPAQYATDFAAGLNMAAMAGGMSEPACLPAWELV